MLGYLLANPALVTAFLSAVATVFAAVAAWRGPSSAAKLAEKMRRSAERDAEARRLKTYVFTTLMQERASISAPDSVRALNLIDVVYSECPKVREAWAELFLTFDGSREVPRHVQDEKYRGLLKEMAAELDLDGALKLDDLGRVYYPNALAQEDQIRELQRMENLKRLLPRSAPTSNVADGLLAGYFPPRPSEDPHLE